ncbi:MAG: hypothetical protein ACI4MT_00125 [Christensenellales bacterium]
MDYLLPDDDTMEKMAIEYAKARRKASVLECAKDNSVTDKKNSSRGVTCAQNDNGGAETDNPNGGGTNASDGAGENGATDPNGNSGENSATENGSDLTETELREIALMKKRVTNTAVILMFLKSLKK